MLVLLSYVMKSLSYMAVLSTLPCPCSGLLLALFLKIKSSNRKFNSFIIKEFII